MLSASWPNHTGIIQRSNAPPPQLSIRKQTCKSLHMRHSLALSPCSVLCYEIIHFAAFIFISVLMSKTSRKRTRIPSMCSVFGSALAEGDRRQREGEISRARKEGNNEAWAHRRMMLMGILCGRSSPGGIQSNPVPPHSEAGVSPSFLSCLSTQAVHVGRHTDTVQD